MANALLQYRKNVLCSVVLFNGARLSSYICTFAMRTVVYRPNADLQQGDNGSHRGAEGSPVFRPGDK